MPSTPFHIPPSTVVGFPARRHLDLPSFLVANLTIDIEPGIAMLLDLGPPPHGLAHTLLGGVAVGGATGWLVWRATRWLAARRDWDYPLSRRRAVLSGIAGCWFHVLLDAVMYDHLRPFFPLPWNPLHVPGSGDALHLVTGLLFVPALLLLLRARAWRSAPERIALTLLALSAVGMVAAVATGRV
jgi:membrane-bound metal-dependent hydrolase YbcI (DUF457 family)